MATNQALRALMTSHGVSADCLARAVGVDLATIHRWIDKQERVPHRTTRSKVCALLQVDEARLWPQLAESQQAKATSKAELVTVYPDRGQVPKSLWTTLVRDAEECITLLVYAGLFWFDSHPEMRRLLKERADDGVMIRLAFGDPDSASIAQRGEEERIDMAGRTKLTLGLVNCLVGHQNIEVRLHSTTLYTSMYRADDVLLANTHVHGSAAADSPVLHLHHLPGGQMFQHYTESFERIWETAVPYQPAAATPPQ